MRRLIVGVAVLSMIAVAHAGHAITPIEMTHTSIGETRYRIHLYAKTHGKLPPNLKVLPKRNGYANSVEDGWGAPLSYRIFDDGTFTLSSLGEDRKAGGVGDSADIVTRFRWRDRAGRFIAADQYWISEGEIEGAGK